VTIAEWKEGQEPLLQWRARRFITNMGFANFVTPPSIRADPRITGSCMVISRGGRSGRLRPGQHHRKLVISFSSTSDPIFSLRRAGEPDCGRGTR